MVGRYNGSRVDEPIRGETEINVIRGRTNRDSPRETHALVLVLASGYLILFVRFLLSILQLLCTLRSGFTFRHNRSRCCESQSVNTLRCLSSNSRLILTSYGSSISIFSMKIQSCSKIFLFVKPFFAYLRHEIIREKSVIVRVEIQATPTLSDI